MRNESVRLPIGQSDFKEIISGNFIFIDKSLLIKEIIDDTAEVISLPRPRRFGKTINLSMLRYFFATHVAEQSTKGLFDQLAINQYSTYMEEHQGKYAVIFISFKDSKDNNFNSAYASMAGFVLGLIVSLQKTHTIKSNHESGYGRYDVMIVPKELQQLGIILEFKTVTSAQDNLESAAQQALEQITARRYITELEQIGVKNCLKLGLAFRGKEVSIAHERVSLK